MGSNPFRAIPLLGISSPCRGNYIISGTGSARAYDIFEADLEESQNMALMVFGLTCIKIVNFNICCIRLYKSELLTLEL